MDLLNNLCCLNIVLLLLVTPCLSASFNWSATPFYAPSIPLSVRSPYLNAWFPQGPVTAPLNSLWPNLWTPTTPTIVGWAAAIQVDNTTYGILGDQSWPNNATQVSYTITPTRTIFQFTAGPVNVNASFLSPINPTDLTRQSLPFSYFYLDIESTDGKEHDVNVYTDITGEWTSGDLDLVVEWSETTQDGAIILQIRRQNIAGFSEINDHAEDVTAYYSILQNTGAAFQIGHAGPVREGFVANVNFVNGSIDSDFRSISNNFPVLAIAVKLGNIKNTSSPVVIGLGLLRDPAIQYTTTNGENQLRSNYFWSNFSTPAAAITFSLEDFENALNISTALDAQIQSYALQVSSEYADLLALTLRQAMGAMEITLSQDSLGNWNQSDIKVFMKNIGSGSGGVNEVDVLYAAFPVFLYLNPQFGKYLLAPLLEFQESSLYTNPYAAQNLGTSYPNATGNTAAHNLGIQESANMIIMTLAHAQATGDSSLIVQHYNLLNKWGQYLVSNSLAPNLQITDDGLSGANQTNLALNGIIGIAAMANISAIVNSSSDSIMYKNTTLSYINQWEALATSSDGSHLLARYGEQSSSGLIYNLYADKLLRLNLVSDSIYNGQSSFYSSQAGQSQNLFGLPTDSSDETSARTDWMMLTAGSITDPNVRQEFISKIHQFASANLDSTPLASSYNVSSGVYVNNLASPAQGAMFSLLALNGTIRGINVTSGPIGSATNNIGKKVPTHINVAAIAGGVIGGMVCLIGTILLVYFVRRRRLRKPHKDFDIDATIEINPILLYRTDGFNAEHTSSNEALMGPVAQNKSSVSSLSIPAADSDDGNAIPTERANNVGYAVSIPNRPIGSEKMNSANTLRSIVGTSDSAGSSTISGATEKTASSRSSETNTEDVVQLRSEIENIRREMDRIRGDRYANIDDAPPSYATNYQ